MWKHFLLHAGRCSPYARVRFKKSNIIHKRPVRGLVLERIKDNRIHFTGSWNRFSSLQIIFPEKTCPGRNGIEFDLPPPTCKCHPAPETPCEPPPHPVLIHNFDSCIAVVAPPCVESSAKRATADDDPKRDRLLTGVGRDNLQ